MGRQELVNLDTGLGARTKINENFEELYPFDTVADMVAATFLTVGQTVRTLGYTTVGDGGDNSYNIVAAATGTDDGGLFIDLDTHQALGLFLDGIVNGTQFGAIVGVDSTVAVQAAAAAAKATSRVWGILDAHTVSTIILDDFNGVSVHSRGSLIGLATGTVDAVLEIKNTTGMTWTGRLAVDGSYNINTTSGVKIWADDAAGCSLFDIENMIIVRAQTAWQFGDTAEPDRLLSEINITGGYTYACPQVIKAIGSQCVISFVNSNIITGVDGGDAGWQALDQTTATAVGATVRITGGEVQHTVDTAYSTFHIQPITSPGFDNNYGSIHVVNSAIESAATLALSSDPLAVTSPVSGAISLIGCSGTHTQNSFPFVSTDANFTGKVEFAENDFKCTVARTQPNVQCAGDADVYVDEQSFGSNFMAAVAGVTGGIVHFSQRQIGYYINVAGQALPNATPTTLIYGTKITGDTYNRFNADYNNATGVFTVPAGGLKGVHVIAQLGQAASTAANSEFYIQLNGAATIGITANAKWQHGSVYLGDLAAGTTIEIVFFNISVGAVVAGSVATDLFQISAWN